MVELRDRFFEAVGLDVHRYDDGLAFVHPRCSSSRSCLHGSVRLLFERALRDCDLADGRRNAHLVRRFFSQRLRNGQGGREGRMFTADHR